MTRYEKMIVCDKCGGTGVVTVYDDRERCYGTVVCERCGGKRVLKMKVSVTYERIEDENGESVVGGISEEPRCQ